jgi:hypothetical protein
MTSPWWRLKNAEAKSWRIFYQPRLVTVAEAVIEGNGSAKGAHHINQTAL